MDILTIRYKNLKLRRETWTEDTNLGIIGMKTVTDNAIMTEISPREKAHCTLILHRWGEQRESNKIN